MSEPSQSVSGLDLPVGAESLAQGAENLGPAARLLQQTRRPLHGGETLPGGAARLDVEAVKHNLERRKRLRKILKAYKGPDPGEWARQGLASGREDLWRRAIHISGRISGADPQSQDLAEALARELDAILAEGRWDLLSGVCGVLSTGAHGPDDDPRRRGLKRVLESLSTSARMLGLQQKLEGCSADELAGLLQLIRLLPDLANRPLAQMLIRLPEGDSADELEALLRQRGTDLTELDIRRLRSADEDQVLAAIEALGNNLSTRAVDALAGALRQKSPVVRAAALRALLEPARQGRVPMKFTHDIVGGLASPVADIRQLSFELLEALPHNKGAADLVELVKQNGRGKWDAGAAGRALRLLVRWGGPVAREFMVKRVAAANVFRRQGVEEARLAVIEAARQVGGEQGRSLLSACLEARVPGNIHDLLQAALEQL